LLAADSTAARRRGTDARRAGTLAPPGTCGARTPALRRRERCARRRRQEGVNAMKRIVWILIVAVLAAPGCFPLVQQDDAAAKAARKPPVEPSAARAPIVTPEQVTAANAHHVCQCIFDEIQEKQRDPAPLVQSESPRQRSQ